MKNANHNIVITVSREAGSGGKLIAKKVAKHLDIGFYDESLVSLIAQKTRRRKNIIHKLDEKDRNILKEFISQLLDAEYLSPQSYINQLCWTIGSLAKQKSCVILGRGANFILPDKNYLHVRIIAPFLVRVGYTQKYEHRTKYDAEKRVKKYDFERKAYIQQYFGKNPSNANYYDLVINTERISINEAVNMIIKAAKLKLQDSG